MCTNLGKIHLFVWPIVSISSIDQLLVPPEMSGCLHRKCSCWVNPTDAVVMFLERWTKCSLCEGIECNSWKLLVWSGILAGTDACALVSLFQIQLQQMQCITCRALGVDVCFWRAQWPWSALLGDYSNCCGFTWAWGLLQDLSQSWPPC